MDKDINDRYLINDITNNKIDRDKWFVGSALMGQDFNQLLSGFYYYEQDTIWSRVLDMEQINPYWEIHNRTKNYLIKNQKDELNINFLIDYISCVCKSSKNENIYIITSDTSAGFLLEKHGYRVLKRNIPFFINKERVGSYLKVFINVDNHIYPLCDCTFFKWMQDTYMEINMNLFYEDMLSFRVNKKVPEKYKFYTSVFQNTESYDRFYLNQDKIRFLSLLDCTIYLSEQNCQIKSKYNGHTTKRIIKDMVFYSQVLDLDLSEIYSYIHPDFQSFISEEIYKLQKRYLEILKNKKGDFFATYGISPIVQKYLTGDYVSNVYALSNECKYFTDFPFLLDKQDFEKFCWQVDHILEKRN